MITITIFNSKIRLCYDERQAHSSVIADIVTRKFVDSLPLYRQEIIHARDGIELSRQTMSGLVIQLHEKLTPLMAAIHFISEYEIYGLRSMASRGIFQFPI